MWFDMIAYVKRPRKRVWSCMVIRACHPIGIRYVFVSESASISPGDREAARRLCELVMRADRAKGLAVELARVRGEAIHA
jgi:hypothetical protein